MSETAQYVDLATVDRLAQKVTVLVQILERTRQELAESRADNQRLNEELSALQDRLTDAQKDAAEVESLRAEREQVRSRVSGMLDQLEALDL